MVIRRIRFLVTESLLWAAAVLGVIAVILVVCAVAFNITLILFRTGSMEPTIPAGSVAVVQEVPADEVQVGDVLTVERPDQMPVTHRVTSVTAGDSPEERVITMRGDANDSDDPYPYEITEAREVLFSIPGLAAIIHGMGDPRVLAGITVAASLLVGWAFWPKRGPRPPRGGPSAGDNARSAGRRETASPSSRPMWGRTHASRPRKAILPAVVISGMFAGASPVALTTETEATWVGSSYSRATLSSATLAPVRNLRCEDGGLLRNAALAWDAPASGEGVEGYRVSILRNGQSVGTADLPLSQQRYNSWPSSLLQVGAVYQVQVSSRGPGSWVSESWNAQVRVLAGVGGISIIGGCTAGAAPRSPG